MNIESLNDIWNAVCEDIKKSGEVTEAGFNLWIKDLKPVELRQDGFILSTSGDIKKNVVETTYMPILTACLKNIIGIETPIKVMVEDKSGNLITPETDNSVFFDKTFTFDNFIVGSTNRFAHAAAMAVADNPFIIYNPLVIYGKSGVGKTHLMLAIKNHILGRAPEKRIVYTSGEDFTNQLVTALRDGTIENFREKFRTADVLLMDDIHFIAGKEQTQEEFFNTFNTLYQNNKQIVVTLDRPVMEVKTLEERIRSRLESGLLADISSPDFETRVGIVKTKSELLGITLSENVIYYIAEHIRANTRQLEGVVKKLQAYIMFQKKSPTIPIVQGFIRDIVNDPKKEPIKIEQIISEVARNYSIQETDILSHRRTAVIAYARQISMYIAKETTELSYKAIGESFGKDHTTVLYACREIEKKIKQDPFEKEIIEEIIKNIKGE
ncbi:MAG: chromosomal replication initiator protein DnaA [Clostridia bacterium]|nr:chromosomal replication initiator protein DnaA [Clostridia bacterium]